MLNPRRSHSDQSHSHSFSTSHAAVPSDDNLDNTGSQDDLALQRENELLRHRIKGLEEEKDAMGERLRRFSRGIRRLMQSSAVKLTCECLIA